MKKQLSNYSFYLSVLSVLLAAIGAFGVDLWLASTQWMIIAVVLAIWSIYLKDKEGDRLND
jgi:uncharacterized membrane protein